jgi:hypothetical protein
MKILNNLLSEEQIDLFKQYWDDYPNQRYVNWKIGDEVLDYRMLVKSNPVLWKIVTDIVSQDFSDTVEIWSALQSQRFAHNIHVDDYGVEKYPDIPMYTYIFALDTVPEFKTVVWKEIVKSNADIPNYLKLWNLKRHKLPKVSTISTEQDLEHTYDENAQAYLCDYLTLDGIFEYQAGSGVLFNGRQLHCTSNWLKYKKFNSRELLQIHVVSHDLKTSLT